MVKGQSSGKKVGIKVKTPTKSNVHKKRSRSQSPATDTVAVSNQKSLSNSPKPKQRKKCKTGKSPGKSALKLTDKRQIVLESVVDESENNNAQPENVMDTEIDKECIPDGVILSIDKK